MNQPVLGIDIGGSSLKFGPVDTNTGQLTTPAQSLSLPQPATATALLESVRECRSIFGTTKSFGVGFPGVVQNGVIQFAPHVDQSLVGRDWLTDLKSLTDSQSLSGSQSLGDSQSLTDSPVVLLNDADAATLAEMQFGAGSQPGQGPIDGTVLLFTLGTGIGSALVRDGCLFPNTEFGHLLLDDTEAEGLIEAEDLAAALVRTREDLSWAEYGVRLNRFLTEMERLLAPDRIIIGGGISENFSHFAPYLRLKAEVVPTALGNTAGLIGAALAASR